jgi:hypothetical protein
MSARDPLERAIEQLNQLPGICNVPTSKHLASIDAAITDTHLSLQSFLSPHLKLLAHFMIAELTLMKGYIAVKSPSNDRKQIGAVYLDEVLRVVKDGLAGINITVFVGLDAETLYSNGDIKPIGTDREWDIKHLLSHYNSLAAAMAELKSAPSEQRREIYLCRRVSLRQMRSIANAIADNRYQSQ